VYQERGVDYLFAVTNADKNSYIKFRDERGESREWVGGGGQMGRSVCVWGGGGGSTVRGHNESRERVGWWGPRAEG
jgi:hypothetical protein